jgi:hypothetical protein
VTTRIRAAALSHQFRLCYTAIAAVGKKAETIATCLVLQAVKPRVSKAERLTFAIDDTPLWAARPRGRLASQPDACSFPRSRLHRVRAGCRSNKPSAALCLREAIADIVNIRLEPKGRLTIVRCVKPEYLSRINEFRVVGPRLTSNRRCKGWVSIHPCQVMGGWGR